ncbi:hypothetical protein FE257_001542 [Aspergillus nanangensis]|uniref:Pinin/SDK/MemA protein domain-containing protein n=1 Tax=Aspergillus nanangensis TaxID=2582783 RepID=A0AAD4CTI1_ASPNN|nr:hypothetical protein FE257_001542 [Aspergillus nanangensis]
MAEESLASAVAIPEQEPTIPSPDAGLKRRRSSPDPDTKRRRLSSQSENKDPQQSPDRKPSSPDIARNSTRQPRGRDDERKRGQRLFGGLLGTLSQSSSSAAQKRRADIERRQQDKLKLQDEEYGELKKKRREDRLAVRMKEQRIYAEESMRTRHSNLLAMAHFLKTRSEPILYYKPWQLRSDDEATIQEQIKDVEATIAREAAEFEAQNPPEEKHEAREGGENDHAGEEVKEQPPLPDTSAKETSETAQVASDPVGAKTNHDQGSEGARADVTSTNENHEPVHHDQTDVHRDDDGGEVVEDQEDTVIY